MYENFIRAVPAQHDGGRHAKIRESARDPAGERSLPRSADSEIADADNRNGRRMNLHERPVVQFTSNRNEAAIKRFKRKQDRSCESVGGFVALPDAVYEAHATSSASDIMRSSRGASAAASLVVGASILVGGPYAIVIRANGLGIMNPSQLESFQARST